MKTPSFSSTALARYYKGVQLILDKDSPASDCFSDGRQVRFWHLENFLGF